MNLLTINTSKTSYMILAAKNKVIPEFEPLRINNKLINRSHQEKYLGLLIDDKLTWRPHIERVQSKLTSLLGALRKVSHCIPKTIKPVIYNTLVKPHLEYLVEIWGSAASSNLNSLQRTQNKIIKVLFHYPFRTATIQLYNKTKIFNLNQIYIYNTCILIKKILTKTIKSNLVLNIKTNKHNLRKQNKLKLITPRTNYGRKTILFEGVQLYNNLPESIKKCKSVETFKSKLKIHITASSDD